MWHLNIYKVHVITQFLQQLCEIVYINIFILTTSKTKIKQNKGTVEFNFHLNI